MATAIPSPANAATMSAAEVIAHIREHGGRVFRFVGPPRVFVLTSDPELVAWMVARKARPFAPAGSGVATDGSYTRDSVTKLREWDMQISSIPVTDLDEVGHAIWKAAA